MGRAIDSLMMIGLLAAMPVVAAEAVKQQRLYWPHIALSKDRGERVESIEVEMACGRFRAVSSIPNDWSMEVISPSSEVTHLRASAGHGVSMLNSLRELDGAIVVAVKEASCFDISGTVTVAVGGDSRKTYKFKRSELRLRP